MSTGQSHFSLNREDMLTRKHKIPISCTARKVTNHDFSKFDYIIAMDQSKYVQLSSGLS